MGDVKKVAILGGGVGAMTAAHWLLKKAEEPGATQYDITVYQLGWRLGGKGASGRNMTPGFGHRIEEHGLHMFMGFYVNTFRMMEETYEQLGRKPGTPLATWRDAFKPGNFLCNESKTKLAWYPWLSHFPPNDGNPAEIAKFRDPHDYLELIAKQVRKWHSELKKEVEWVKADPADAAIDVATAEAIVAMIPPLEVSLDALVGEAVTAIDAANHAHLGILGAAKLAQKLVHDVIQFLTKFSSLERVDAILRWAFLIDLGLAVVVGMIKHVLCLPPHWDKINDIEWQTWLVNNGMSEQTKWMPYIRAVYDMIFAFKDGIADEEHANVAAGWATLGGLRMFFEYQGGLFWKMQAGMGDTIFGPFYELLKRQGVKFEFFHRVREVVPTTDGSGKIDHVRIGRQVRIKDGLEYAPLVDVEGLPSWPVTPHYDQIVNGDLLRDGNIDLEDYGAPWPDVEEIRLHAGVDFDWVVFGLSLGAVPYVCPQLMKQSPAWQAMVDNVGTVRTQASQLWLNKDVAELGWPPAMNGGDIGPDGQRQRVVFGSYVEPLDTWADMTHLIPRETWPVTDDVQNIAYFCGPAAVNTVDADPYLKMLEVLRFDFHWIWTKAYAPSGEFRYELLVDPAGGHGIERLRTQYFRLNYQPSELYVQSFAGTTKYRLEQKTGYSNLCIVGDWNRSPFPLGCVEGAVIGGMYGIEPITGPLPIVR